MTLKKAWDMFVQIAVLLLIGFLIWQGYKLVDRLDGHEKEIKKVQSAVLTIDTNGKQVQTEVKGLSKLLQAPPVYHQYYQSTVTGNAAYAEREKDPATGKPTGAQISGTMTMGDLLFEFNGKKYEIPSKVVENGWLENGQFKFNMQAKNEVIVRTNKGPSLDLVFNGGYGSDAIRQEMKPYGEVALEYRIHLLK